MSYHNEPTEEYHQNDTLHRKKLKGQNAPLSILHNETYRVRYKTRLVAEGYTQTYGIDYSEAFSPVAKIDTIRVLFSIAANVDWPLHQFDVKNAFLHGELKEEVYMEAPPGFSGNFNDREVCRLKKSLYGRKQSPRACWAGEKGDRKSTSGFFTLVGGNLVSWRNKKQKVVSLSSAESKFRGIAKGVVEALWIKKLLTEIGFPPQEAIQIMFHNEATITISENPIQHDRTKHVEIDRHFIIEKLDGKTISLPSIRSED
ncbi:uncharacterized protein [Rutidosis leptorrhynchoides]|uniref:uncharacterized protein n=1 Tax=Rutidosis leptorrhynchoides TaxID=125765 RepID=UPI003A9A1A7E